MAEPRPASPSPPSPVQRRYHDVVDRHRRTPWLADVVLGGQDGIVNVLGVVLGMATATGSSHLVLVAGLATAVAESASMAAVAYTTRTAEGDLFRGEQAREYRHLAAVPNIEREEVRAIYARQGFSGDLLDRIVETVTANPDTWVAVMMSEEHRLVAVDRRTSLRSSLVVGASSLGGSLLPLVPFLVLPMAGAKVVAAALAACTLFAFGAYKARVTVGSPMKGGLELAAVGMLAGVLGWAVGAVLRVPV